MTFDKTLIQKTLWEVAEAADKYVRECAETRSGAIVDLTELGTTVAAYRLMLVDVAKEIQ